MNERIKQIRKSLGMTQQEFANMIGTSRPNIAGYETNKRSPSSAVISAICKACKINETWLRTGKGEMTVELTEEQYITDFIADILIDKRDSFKKRYITMLSKLDEDGWDALEKVALSFINVKRD